MANSYCSYPNTEAACCMLQSTGADWLCTLQRSCKFCQIIVFKISSLSAVIACGLNKSFVKIYLRRFYKALYTRLCRMVRKRFANQMHVCVVGTANLRCAVHERFAYRLLRNKICRFFAQTQRELDAPGVLFMHQVSFARLRFAEN